MALRTEAASRREALGGLAAAPAAAAEARRLGAEASDVRQRIARFTLGNGLTVVCLPRSKTPIVGCHTRAAVGAAQEPEGGTGVAHFLEHLAFKGTQRVGTTDWARESALLDEVDDMYYAVQAAELEGRDAGRARREFQRALAAAAELRVDNAYGSLIQRAGGVGLNATTSHDSTDFFVALPANQLELWFALEADRLRFPTLRALYEEKEVIREERRLRVDNSRFGRFTEAFALAAFGAGEPYGRPVVGWPDDFDALGRREVRAFYDSNYTPDRLTISVCGDCEPERVRDLAERYFGDWRPTPTVPLAGRPGADAGRLERTLRADGAVLEAGSPATLRAELRGGPLYLAGYRRSGDDGTPDATTLDVICDVLAGSRASRFQRELVQPGRALTATLAPTWPASQRSTLLLLQGVPEPGAPLGGLASEMEALVDTLASRGGVTDAELRRCKKKARVGLLDAFRSNVQMASLLARFEATRGDARLLLEEPVLIDSVSPRDVRRVAERTFSPSNVVLRGLVSRSAA